MTREEQDRAFTEALQAHQRALAEFGEDDPRTVEAILAVMCLAPDELFAEMEERARATVQ